MVSERESERLRGWRGGKEEGRDRERERGKEETVNYDVLGENTAREDLSLNKQFYMQFPQTYFHLL